MTAQQRAARKKWIARLARRDRADHAHCANCDAGAPAGPCETGYSAAGVLEHRWQCPACGNQWSTPAEE